MNSAIGEAGTEAGQKVSAGLRPVHTPLFWKCGFLLLTEPDDVSESQILTRVMEGSYGKPFVREHHDIRYLHFDMHSIQSAMRLDDPFALDLAYTRKMMAFLLFNSAPRDVLLLGLGGGSLAKFCYRHLPQTRTRVVEIDPEVIALRRHFLVPEDDERFEVIKADGADYVSACPAPVDVLIIDAFDRQGIAPSLSSRAFYRRARRNLTPTGMLVMNLAGEKSKCWPHLARIRDAFGGGVIRIGLDGSTNSVLFAFNDPEPDWKCVEQRAQALKAALSLDFPRFARRLKAAWRSRPNGEARPSARQNGYGRSR